MFVVFGFISSRNSEAKSGGPQLSDVSTNVKSTKTAGWAGDSAIVRSRVFVAEHTQIQKNKKKKTIEINASTTGISCTCCGMCCWSSHSSLQRSCYRC